MATEMIVREEHYVAPNSKLAKQERRLAEAVETWGEDYFHVGVVLTEIKDAEYWKTEAGYTNFDAYCKERQPCGFRRTYVWQLIAAARVRPYLPKLTAKDDSGIPESLWFEDAVRPLTSKEFTPADVRRIGKKIATLVRKEKKLTAAMVKAICDDERGVERKQRKAKEKAFREAALDNNLKRAISMVQELRVALQMYPLDAWEEVEDTNPQLVKSLIRELDAFTSFLKG